MEIWKDIEGYEGLYQISNLGNVKSLARVIINKHGKEQTYPEKLLTPDVYVTNYSNYLRVTLSKNHNTKRYSVHRLVAEAFIPNPENKTHVNHIDNNAENNFVENLEWCTHSENMLHAQKQGRLFASQSKGGKRGGIPSAAVRLDAVNSLHGTYVGDWFVENQQHQVKGEKAYVFCRCRCGTEHWVEVTRLMRRETTKCRACGQRQRKR